MAPKKKSPVSEGIKEITGGYKPVATPKDATGMQGVGITGTDRNVAKEIEAAKLGYSPEYIASRGGLNSQGYFNDVALSGQLTAEEQRSVRLPNGTVNTQAMADILQKKQIDEKVAGGMSVAEATRIVSEQYGKFGTSMPEAGYDAMGNKTPGGQYNASGSFIGSASTGGGVSPTGTGTGGSDVSRSAYDLVTSELTRLGLSSLINPLREIFESGISEGDSLRLALSQRPEYQTRFSANAKRIAAGLSALTPAEYIQLEDQYQTVMRNYGLPATYYAKDSTGKQIGFDELLAGDVSNTELEERLIAAQDRVLKSNPEVLQALKTFYPSINNGEILAYSLDPKNALKDIQRKISAAEIGGAALAQGLATSAAGAEELAGFGVTKAQAQQGFADVAQMAPRGSALSEIYNEAPYNQATATAEVFGTSGAAEATQKRKKLTALEQATFGGQSGLAQGALARNSGAGAF
jgi:hypothetical protein